MELQDVVLSGQRFEHRGIPTLMVPTTSGTGSEATQNSIVLVPEQELKVGIVDEKLVANCVILDPEMTISLPKHITANTGIDALCHAIECYISKKSNPFSDMFALKAINLISKSIRTAYNDGSNLQAREDMLLGAYLGGMYCHLQYNCGTRPILSFRWQISHPSRPVECNPAAGCDEI